MHAHAKRKPTAHCTDLRQCPGRSGAGASSSPSSHSCFSRPFCAWQSLRWGMSGLTPSDPFC
eukprot:242848-Chlamydomonas_euryale.AAC.3